MAEATATEKSGKLVIQNIGLLLSGDIDRPILDADTIVVHDGLITAVGKRADCDTEGAKHTIDARRTAVAPGLIDSPAIAAAVPPEAVKQMVPARRLGTPEEVADLVAFLCSDRAAYITGQAISVNGGMA